MGYSHEAVELRDDDKKVYMGKGVLKAVSNINDKIAPALLGMDPTQQAKIDKVMMEIDKTENKVHILSPRVLEVTMLCNVLYLCLWSCPLCLWKDCVSSICVILELRF